MINNFIGLIFGAFLLLCSFLCEYLDKRFGDDSNFIGAMWFLLFTSGIIFIGISVMGLLMGE